MFWYFFVLIQSSLAMIMLLHDWVHVPPLTDIKALKNNHPLWARVVTTVVNSMTVLVPLAITLRFFGTEAMPLWAVRTIFWCYLGLTIGTIASWWVPYIFGSSAAHKKGFAEYASTHRFLPARGDNVVPNTLHVILHAHVWLCLFFAWVL